MAIAWVNGSVPAITPSNPYTFSYSPTAGHFVMLWLVTNSGSATIVSVKDNLGNVYNLLPAGFSQAYVVAWGIAASGVTSYTVTITSTFFVDAIILGEWSGVSGLGTSAWTNPTGVATPVSVSQATTQNGSWIVAFLSVVITTGNPTLSASTGNLRESSSGFIASQGVGLVDNTTATVGTSVTDAMAYTGSRSGSYYIFVVEMFPTSAASTFRLLASTGVGT